MTTACPSRQQLLDYAVGKLDEPALDEVSRHVEQCQTCQSLLATLDDGGDTVLARLRGAPVVTGFEHEPEYQQAVAAAKAVVAGAVATIPPWAAHVGSSRSDEIEPTQASDSESAEPPDGMPPSSSEDGPATSLPELGDYELLGKLGQGGMGAVYKARHKKLKRIMAIKLLPKERLANPTALARFEREMEAVGAVDHPNIVRAMHAGEYDGTPYLAVEYVDGLNLSDLVARVGPLRIPDACELIRQTAVGLQHAYEQGLMHRDIKPSNLMVALSGQRSAVSHTVGADARGGGETKLKADSRPLTATVKILDLGLALLDSGRPPGQEMTAAGTAMGTADYVSPEQVSDSHSVDIRSDIYSLGCTLYKLLSGQAPFVGPDYKNEFHKMLAHVQKTPPPISLLRTDLPPELTAIIERMMAKQPDQRFATPAEVAEALAPLAAGADLPALLAEATGLAAPSRTAAPRTASTASLSASPHTDTGVGSRSPVSPRPEPSLGETRPRGGVSPRRQSSLGETRLRGRVAVALAALAGLILLGVVLLRVKTPAGTIILEVDQLEIAGAVVEVDGQQRMTIDPGQGLEKVTVAADEKEHVLRVTKGGFETFTRKFTLKAGQSQTITVRLEPLAASSAHVAESLRDSNPVSERPGYVGVPPRDEKSAAKPAPLTQPPAKTETASRPSPPPAERESYGAMDAAWTLGPLYDVLTGFIPRPTKLPGIKRWQIVPNSPRQIIRSMDWSSTGLLACTSWPHVWIYDAETLQLKAVIRGEQTNGVSFLAWSPDGSQLATGGYYLWLWRPDGSLDRKLEGRVSEYAKFSWSPDGQQIACGDGADPKQVRIVNLDGTPGLVFKGHEDTVTAVAWSPDGKQLVSSSRDKTVRIWNLDGTSGPVLKGHGSSVTDVDWSPDGQWIASAGQDAALIWKAEGTAGPVIRTGNLSNVQWHSDSRRVVVMSGASSQYLAVYDVEGKLINHLRDFPGGGGGVAWSPDGKHLVAGDAIGNLLIWDASGRRLRSLTGGSGEPMMVAWSSTGQLASKTFDGTLAFWTAEGQLQRTVQDRTGGGRDMKWSPDGKVLLSAGASNMQLWNADGTRGKSVFPHGDYVAWSPDGKQFAALTGSGIRIWDADTNERKSWNHGGASYHLWLGGNSLNWSADSQWLAHGAGNEASALPHGSRLWHADGTSGPTLDETGPVVAFHPQEPLLATMYPNLRLWRIEAKPPSADKAQEPAQASASVRSAGGAGEARLSSVWSRDVLPTPGHLSPTLDWSPDGQWLAVESESSNVRLVDVSGRRGPSIRGLGDVQSLSWSPDSRQLAMGLWDERVAVCDAQTGQTIWIGVHLPGGETAVFSGAGQLLPGQESKMDVFDKHLACVVEHPDGRMEVVKPSQFPARAAELARQAPVPEWAKPVPTLPDGSIDLLLLVEIKPDAKPETEWTRDGKTLLAPQKDTNRQLPIPITLSGDYDLVVQAEAPSQVAGLFLLLQADGHPVESVLCASGHVSGLQLIDGQDVGQNGTMLRESLLGQGQKLQLTCQVRRNQIRVLLDDREIVKWEGEFDRLSVTNSWGASALDGIFGLLAHAPYRIHELKLVPRSDEAKQSVNTVGDRAFAEKLQAMGATVGIRQSGLEREYGPVVPVPLGFFRVTSIYFRNLLSDAEMPEFASLVGSLPQLRSLNLTDSDITDDGLKRFPPLRALQRLVLRGTLVRNPLPAAGIEKTRLEGLYLTGTDLMPEAFDEIGKCDNLNGLGLVETGLTDDRLLRVAVLPRLGNVAISDNPLELNEKAIRHLAGFGGLRYFTADRLPASEERLMQLTELKQLTVLSLVGTKTTDRVLAELQKLPNLRELKIQETPATEAGVKAFQAAKPNCKVEWSPAP